MLHFLAGAAIASLVAFGAVLLGQPSAGLWGLLAAAVAGLLKEGWDSLGRGTVEASDALWAAAGALPALALWGLMS